MSDRAPDVLELVEVVLAHGIQILEFSHVGFSPRLLRITRHTVRFVTEAHQGRINDGLFCI
jgi:hypothetical protein